MNIFLSKKFMKICSKAHQITPFKKIFFGKHAPEPPSKRFATPSYAGRFEACNLPSPSKSWAPLCKSCIRPWTTTKKFI